jgi:5'-3' exonuclease
VSTGPLVIIDGHNLFIRNFVVNPKMDVNGNRCGGTIGTVQSVKKLLNDLSPSNVLVVWDGEGGSQRRKAIYSAYKEGRTIRRNQEYDFGETPEEQLENLRMQRQNAADYLSLLGIPQVRADGVEADDLMAYVAGKMDHDGGCVIVTTDKDLLQLVRGPFRKCDECKGSGENDAVHQDIQCNCTAGDEQPSASHAQGCERWKYGSCTECMGSGDLRQSEVRVLSPIKGITYDRETFISEFGVLPENFRLVKALTGDRSDNIEGIKGFGDKTVLKSFPFLAKHRATLADVLEAAEKMTGVIGKRLVEQKDRFVENLTLVDLSDPMLSATAARQAREAMYRDMGCKELEFRMRMGKDGIQLSDDRLVQPFRELVIRRRRALETFKVQEEFLDTEGVGDE